MSQIQTLLFAALAGLAVLLVGALSPQGTEPTEGKPDPAAARTFEDAIATLARSSARWLKMGLWQQGNLAALNYRAEGTFLAGPDHRLRLDMQVRAGSALSRLCVVSDGRTLWQIEQSGSTEPTVVRVNVQPVFALLESPGTSAKQREDFYQHQFFAGPLALLKSLKAGTTFRERQLARWRDRDVILLVGTRSLPENEKTWPDFLPRRCRLYLDARTLWPHRLEWWGPTPNRSGDNLLLQVEFRDPVFDQPAPEQTFTYQTGKAEVKDLTKTWMYGLRSGLPELGQ